MIGRAVRFTHTLPVRCLVKVTTPLHVEVLEVHCEFASTHIVGYKLICSVTEVYDTSVNAAKLKADLAAKPAGWSGCYANSNLAIFKDYFAQDGSLTEQRCAAVCKTKGFGWVGLANGNTCRCSGTDPTGVNQRWPSKQYCAAPCPGDSKQTCGALGQFTDVYNNTAGLADNSTAIDGYKGCYASIVGLSGPTWTASNMDNGICQTGCKELGYPLAGNSGNACYCGTSWGTGDLVPDYKCTTKCPGNSTEICGASYTTSLWESRLGDNTVIPSGYLGCYTDGGSSRSLVDFSYSSATMTNAVCRSTCRGKGLKLAGTYGNTCSCGDVISNNNQRTPSSVCTTKCGGNSNEFCGANYKLSIYNATASSTTPSGSASSSGAAPSASASGTTSRGCFSDLSVLNNGVYTSAYMTADQCVGYCKGQGFGFAGIVNGNTCRCGSSAPVVNAGRASCTATCVSNSKQSCGGSNTMDVWATTQTGFIDAFSAAAADSTGYMGCWSDGSARTLNGTSFSTSSMTPSSCSANCLAQGFKVSGTESGNQCYCAATIKAGSRRLAESSCAAACTGDKSLICGGSWALAVKVSSSGSGSVSSASSASTSKPASSASASSGSTSKPASSASSASRSASSSASSSVPSSAAIEGYKGCYALGTFVSAAPASYLKSSQMTIGFCRRYCRVQGYSAAGLQNGNSTSYSFHP
jgi:hypothetical protein